MFNLFKKDSRMVASIKEVLSTAKRQTKQALKIKKTYSRYKGGFKEEIEKAEALIKEGKDIEARTMKLLASCLLFEKEHGEF